MKLLRKLPEAHRVQYSETLQGLGNVFLLENILFVEPYCLSYFLAAEIKYLDKRGGRALILASGIMTNPSFTAVSNT